MLLCIIMAMGMQAQKQEHLKFMGIPLDGTISQFQTKLAAKGIKHDVEGSKLVTGSCRIFEGTFSGDKATFYVYYNSSTRIVYRAKAVVSRPTESMINEKFKEYKDLLTTKYPNVYGIDGEQEGFTSFMLIPRSSSSDLLGYISLYISKSGPSYDETFNLHIDYEDEVNEKANEAKRLEDL